MFSNCKWLYSVTKLKGQTKVGIKTQLWKKYSCVQEGQQLSLWLLKAAEIHKTLLNKELLKSSVLNLPTGALTQNEIQRRAESKAGQGCSSHRRDEAQHHHAQPWVCPRPCTPGSEPRSWGMTLGCVRENTPSCFGISCIQQGHHFLTCFFYPLFPPQSLNWTWAPRGACPGLWPPAPPVPAGAGTSWGSRGAQGDLSPAVLGTPVKDKDKASGTVKNREKEKIKKGVGNAVQNREDLKKTSHNVSRFLCGRNEHWQNSHLKGI